MTKLRLFALTFLVTTGAMLSYIYAHRDIRSSFSMRQLKPVAQNLFVTSQLQPDNLRDLKRRGFRTVIDIRPDGEDAAQASSAAIAAAARQYEMDFHYVPVPHESIPESAVETLGSILAHSPGRTVLYCRTGRRAVRTYCLAEASRVGGTDAQQILNTAHNAGFPADDLQADINRRIAHRSDPPPPEKN